jgi:cytochrome P450
LDDLTRGWVPPHPEPGDPSRPFWLRLWRGFHCWFALLCRYDYELPLGSMRFLGRQFFVVNAPQPVRRVMVDEVEAFPKHPYTSWTLQPLIGEAIFSVNGAQWQQQRRLMDQAFQLAQLQRAFPRMAEACAASLARLAPLADGRPVEIDQEMTLVTADVIVRTLTSAALSPEEAAPIFAAFAAYQQRAARALVWRLLRWPKLLLEQGLLQAAAPIRAWMAAAVDHRLACAQPPNDMLQALIEACDPASGARFGREALVDQLCFLFLAGHETSASSLGMAVYLLSCCPELQQRLRQERQEALGDSRRPLAYADLRQLEWHGAVFNETLRLYPPVSFFIREASRNTELGGQRCPMGALLTISPWLIQRHRDHWPDPDCFRPERFLSSAGDREQRLARDAFLPYGLGPRKCPGAAFAQQEAVLVLAELLERFTVLPVPEHTPDLVGRLTLRSRNGIRVRLVPRFKTAR